MPTNRFVLLAAGLALSSASAGAQEKIEFSPAFAECHQAIRGPVEEGLAKCRQPATAGDPTAQYAMGEFLTRRNTGNDMKEGIDWLEKSAATGHPAAMFLLSGLVVRRDDAASMSRGGELFRRSFCTGYPAAVEMVAKAGANASSISCPPSAETNFNGEWTVDLQSKKEAIGSPGVLRFKVSIQEKSAKVFLEADGQWREVKPGKFSVAQQDQSLTVSTMDTGWDYDGRWIESWTIQLMRTGVHEASAAFLRTVNNPHLPARVSWRAFSAFYEGTAKRAAE